ncbi:PTS sugar transporter subunit IIA [soil metagenome]
MQLTLRDVGEMFKESESVVTRWIRQEGLPAQRLAGQFRFNRVEVLDWAIEKRIRVEARSVDHQVDSPSWVSFADALEAGGVHHKVPGNDREVAFGAVVARLPLPDGFDRDMLLRLFLARESLGSTAVGNGIAIPHLRHPIVLNVPRALATLCFLKRPVTYKAPDNKPVRILFSVISPTVAAHVQLLARLSRALHDDSNFMRSVVRMRSRDAIVREVRRFEQSEQAPQQNHMRAA